jgi:hypothetical protein
VQRLPDIVEFVTDPGLLGLALSPAQETLLRAIYGLPLSPDQHDLYRACTGRHTVPTAPFEEATVIAGARAGKDSRIAAPIACYEAIFGRHECHLSRGERGVIPLVAQDQRATQIAFGYIRDYLTRSHLLSALVEDVRASEIALINGITITCFPCTLRSLRGWSMPAGVMDEVAFFRLEGQADADVEVQASIRRGMLAFGTTRLVKISTPYMRGGVLYDDFKRAFGHDDPDLLVWKASSLVMNPITISADRREKARRLDPTRFAREYEAEFADDVDAFLPAAWIDQAVTPGRHELPPRGDIRYVAAVDPSGGGADAFTLAIVHAEGKESDRRIIQDVMRGWRIRGKESAHLEGIVKEIAAICKRYRLSAVTGDRYAAAWVRERFRAEGIRYQDPEVKVPNEPETMRYLDKSLAYLEIEPLFAQGHIELLDHPALARELKLLERRPRAGGRTLVDHPAGGRDDHANALALAATLAAAARVRPFGRAILPPGIRQLGSSGEGSHITPAAGPRLGGQAAWVTGWFNRPW